MAKMSDLPPEIIHRIVEQLVTQSHVCIHHQPNDPGPLPLGHVAGPEVFAASLIQSAFFFAHGSVAGPNIPPTQHEQSDSESENNSRPASTPASASFQSERATGSGVRATKEKSPFGFDYSKMPSRAANSSGPSGEPSHEGDPPSNPAGGPPGIPHMHPHRTPANYDRRAPVACDRVTWPDGLPKDPLLPLALVNRSFQQCSQEMLFKHVSPGDQWQAHLFLQSLKNSCTNPPVIEDDIELETLPIDVKGKGRALSNDEVVQSLRASPRLGKLGDLVRSIRFFWSGRASMGRGGASLICEIINNCQRLENISLSTIFLRHCKEPLLRAMESRAHIKELEVGKVAHEVEKGLVWRYDEIIGRLFTKWDLLESVLLIGLKGSPRKVMNRVIIQLPIFRCTLTILGLTYPDLAGPEMEALLLGSQNTLQAFHLKMPSPKIDRRGLFNVLKNCMGSKLEVLTLAIGTNWHPLTPKKTVGSSASAIISDPSKSPFIVDTLLKAGALSLVKHLTLVGPLISSHFLQVLPDSIVKLAWEGCPNIRPTPLAKFLSSWRSRTKDVVGIGNEAQSSERVRELPNLTCCSVGTDDTHWTVAERAAVKKALEDRQACFHGVQESAIFTAGGFFGPHADHAENDEESDGGEQWTDDGEDDDEGDQQSQEDDDGYDDFDQYGDHGGDPDAVNDAILEAMGQEAAGNFNDPFGLTHARPFAFPVPFIASNFPLGSDSSSPSTSARRSTRGHGRGGSSTTTRLRASDPYFNVNGRGRSTFFRRTTSSNPASPALSATQTPSSSTASGSRTQQRGTQSSASATNVQENRSTGSSGDTRPSNSQANTHSPSSSSSLFGPGFNFGNIFDTK